jgi:D-alanyl-lipoteichoic acid acyltransferase DltB (MBOAT superfamily)
MGPLSKFSEVSCQLFANHSFGSNRFVDGIKRVIFGAFKKIVIADSLVHFTDLVFNGISSFYGFTIALAVLAYAILIYCDFSGYMDIAIGVSYIFGINLPENFDEPYLSPTISDFWRRWHISLGRWLRDYIYIPLGGSKKGVIRKGVNVFVVFLVSGIWHGASWHFILWGLYFGVLSMLSVYLQKPFEIMKEKWQVKESSTIWRIWQIFRTFFLVCIGWLLFRSNSVYSAWIAIKHFFDFGRDTLFSSNSAVDIKSFVLVAAGCVVAFLAKYQFNYKTNSRTRFSIVLVDDYSQVFYHVCLLAVMCLLMFVVVNSSISQASNFTYFNF